MKSSPILAVVLMLLSLALPAVAQHHQSNWVHRSATDTTLVPCWTDSLTRVEFPMNAMSMMMPDSMYMRIDRMPMDSLLIPHDSTFMGWYRSEDGRDSMHFDMMNGDSMNGSQNVMQFMENLRCKFHWDSAMADAAHRHWRVTGMKGWNGSGWVSMSTVVAGDVLSSSTNQIYSAIAFVGTSSGTTSVSDQPAIPGEFRLDQNYPNPFNPSTTIRFSLPHAATVSLKVFNALGQEIATLADGPRQAGNYAVIWDARTFASGVYFCRFSAGNFTQAKKLTLVR